MASSHEQETRPTIFNPETLVKKGLCTVAANREPATHRLYYEIHGDKQPTSSTERIIFIMGLNNSCFGWSNQVDDFGKREGYQVLVFDNRGVGNSDAPRGLYKTSEMAKDVIELLYHVGWTEDRSIHVVGVSMGGMISQELALRIPERIASLTLMSTKAGNKRDLPPVRLSLAAIRWWMSVKSVEQKKGLLMFGRILSGTVTPEAGVKMIADCLYPTAYLDRPDPDRPGFTKRQSVEKDFLRRFNLARRQPFSGRMGQLAAAIGHSLSIEKCGILATKMPKILVITGDDDNLIYPARSKELHNLLPGSEYICIKGGGHALPSQCAKEVNEILIRVIKEGREASNNED